MRVQVRVYRQYDLDLLAIADAGYSLAALMADALIGYANGEPVYYYIDELSDFNIRDKKNIHFALNIPDDEYNAIELIKSVINRCRSAFCKMLLRNALGQQNLYCFFRGYPAIDDLQAIDAQRRRITARPGAVPISNYRSQNTTFTFGSQEINRLNDNTAKQYMTSPRQVAAKSGKAKAAAGSRPVRRTPARTVNNISQGNTGQARPQQTNLQNRNYQNNQSISQQAYAEPSVQNIEPQQPALQPDNHPPAQEIPYQTAAYPSYYQQQPVPPSQPQPAYQPPVQSTYTAPAQSQQAQQTQYRPAPDQTPAAPAQTYQQTTEPQPAVSVPVQQPAPPQQSNAAQYSEPPKKTEGVVFVDDDSDTGASVGLADDELLSAFDKL